jgi:hypothetical protein
MLLSSTDHSPLIPFLETLAAHRASSLLAILPVALQTGYSEVVPELEPLKVRYAYNPSLAC